MEDILIGTEKHRCFNKKLFPPAQMHPTVVEERGGIEEQRHGGFINMEVYQQLLTWQNVCGLFEMSPYKCAHCPHVMVKIGSHHITQEDLFRLK